jgi:hypothetical protein
MFLQPKLLSQTLQKLSKVQKVSVLARTSQRTLPVRTIMVGNYTHI